MKVFLSWSGEQSKALAASLQTWLGDVLQQVTPWMSDHDIQAGARWAADLGGILQDSNFGVICLTRDNLEKPWILFEAGSLAKSIDVARVVPYRLDLSATDVQPPLSQFQGVDATKDGTLRLVNSINDTSPVPLPRDRVERLFEMFWPDLSTKISYVKALAVQGTPQSRTTTDYLTEILDLVRRQSLPSNAPASFETALATVRECLREANEVVRQADLYDAKGGGSETPQFQAFHRRVHRERDRLQAALQQLESDE